GCRRQRQRATGRARPPSRPRLNSLAPPRSGHKTSPMDLEIRPVTADEFPSYSRACEAAFGEIPTDEDTEDWRRQTELDRTLAAFDGGEVVATAGAFSLELTLPGLACVPAAGVTAVSVRTTHRRRGILRRLMTRQLDDVAARGESIAILTASESIIYGRFGYGPASQLNGITIDKDRSAYASPPADSGRLRAVDLQTAAKVLPEVHDRARRRQPGDVSRTGTWWDVTLADRESRRGGRSGLFCVVHEDGAGQADGY